MGCCCCKNGADADGAAAADERAPLLGAGASSDFDSVPTIRRRSLNYGTSSSDDMRWHGGPRIMTMQHTDSFRHRSLKRKYILQEIVSTEVSYRDDLHAMLDHVLIPLRSRSDLIERAHLETIFAGWEVISSVSEDLCDRLETKSQSDSTTTTTITVDDTKFERALEAFCTMSDFLKAIGAFCAGYHRAVATLADAEKASSDLREFFLRFQHTKSEASHGLAIRSFLIKPIQRVTKYPLFFRELLKYTKHDHPLYEKLVEAKDKIEDLVCLVDARVAKQHELTKSMALIKLLGGQQKRLEFLLAPGRHFLFHLRCQVRTHKASHSLLRLQNRKFKDGLLIGLTDKLLLCRPQILGRLRIKNEKACSRTGIQGNWRLKSYLELEGMRISDFEPVFEEVDVSDEEKDYSGKAWVANESEGEAEAPPSKPAPLPETLSQLNKQHHRRSSSTPDLPPRPMFATAPPPIPPKDKAYEVRRRSIAPDHPGKSSRKRATTSGGSKRRSIAAPPIPPKRSSVSIAESDASEHAQSLRENFGTLYLSNIFKEGETFGQVHLHAVEPDVVYEVSMPTDKMLRFRTQIQEARFLCELSRQDLESRRNNEGSGSSSLSTRKKMKLS